MALVAVFALFAATAVEKAGATAITPAAPNAPTNATATLKNDELSWFIPDNAYFPAAVGCTTSNASFQISPSAGPGDNPPGFDLNENRPAVGTYSDDHGGVIGNITDIEFANCAIWGPLTQPAQQYKVSTPPPGPIIPGVTVNTQDGWTVAGRNNGDEEPVVSIGVPPSGAQVLIPVGAGQCILDITPGKAQSVLAEYVNGDPETPTPSDLLVDSQVLFADGGGTVPCSALGFQTTSYKENYAFAQFEGDYDVVDGTGQPVIIAP